MTRSNFGFVLATIVGAITVPAPALPASFNLAALEDARPNIAHVATGVEYGFVAGVGYSRVLRVAERHFVLTSQLTVPWADLDLGDYRLDAGILTPVVSRHRWTLSVALAQVLRGEKHAVAGFTNLGLDAAILAGYYAPRWFVAAEIGSDWAYATRINHSDSYRATGYSAARDGWYRSTAANLRYGAVGGVSADRFDLALRLGQGRDMRGRAQMLPAYATLTLSARF